MAAAVLVGAISCQIDSHILSLSAIYWVDNFYELGQLKPEYAPMNSKTK